MAKLRNSVVNKQKAEIVTVDPSTRRIEAKLKDGGIIQVAIWDTGIAFRWPKVGEVWVLVREGVYWYLHQPVEQGPDVDLKIDDLQPGETKLQGTAIYAPGDFYVLGNFYPSNPDTGWGVINEFEDRVYDADNLTLHELADIVGTLINALKEKNFLDD